MTRNATRWIIIAIATAAALVIIGAVLAHFAPSAFYVFGLALIVAIIVAAVTLITLGITAASDRTPQWTYITIVSVLLITGFILMLISTITNPAVLPPGARVPGTLERLLNPQADDITISYVTGVFLLALGVIGLFLGVIEYAILPALSLSRIGAIARTTYYEALLQPFTIIILFAGMIAIGVSARVAFFTYDEDFKMFRDVASSFVFLFSLPIMIFASTKVIDEEIDNRTMLTLMSKPVSRWQVVLGKYVGILTLVLVCVVSLGIIAAVTSYLRYFDDKLIDYRLAAPGTHDRIVLDAYNMKAFYALLPGLVLAFFQVATLAAISVAVSTRFGLAANITVVVIIYVTANMVQYFQNTTDLPAPVAWLATVLNYLLPSLGLLDLNQRLVFGDFAVGKDDVTLVNSTLVPSLTQIWQYVSISAGYAICYIAAALTLGMALFRSRELS